MNRNKVLTNRAYYKQLTDNDPVAQARAIELCKHDIVFWVNHFCWCFEPRAEVGHQEFPMVLFPYQRWALREWSDHLDCPVGGDIVTEKCRDMGITWCKLYLFIHQWLFRPHSNFLISSFREQEVDYQDSMSTLFPKLRYIIDKLPVWMLPAGYDCKRHATYMKVYNPENQSIIIGSAPVSNFGRSGRYKAILFDELSQWPFGKASWDSASQSTKTRMALATPYGSDNEYARLAMDTENIRMIYPGDENV